MLASFHYSEKKINEENQCPTATANQHLAILSVPCTSHFSEIMKCRPHTIEFSMSSTFSFRIVCNKNIFVFRGFRHLLSEKQIILTFLQPIFKFKVETVYNTTVIFSARLFTFAYLSKDNWVTNDHPRNVYCMPNTLIDLYPCRGGEPLDIRYQPACSLLQCQFRVLV